MTKSEFLAQFKKDGHLDILKAIENEVVSSIRIHTFPITSDEELPIGSSRIGGKPDLPKNIQWPGWNGSSLSFIAQINLAELTVFDIEQELPNEGILFFFFDQTQQAWGDRPDQKDGFRTIFLHNIEEPLCPREFPNDLEAEARFPAVKVHYSQEWSIPGWEVVSHGYRRFLSDEEWEYYNNLEGGQGEINKLLGHPKLIQGPIMEKECEMVAHGIGFASPEYKDELFMAKIEQAKHRWKLLFQIDSIRDCNMMWGDVGRLYYWIDRNSLKNRDFGNIWVILQCT